MPANFNVAAIITINEESKLEKKLGLLSCIPIDSDKDRTAVTQLENRWRSYMDEQTTIRTFYLKMTKSEFLHQWHNPTQKFLLQFVNDAKKE